MSQPDAQASISEFNTQKTVYELIQWLSLCPLDAPVYVDAADDTVTRSMDLQLYAVATDESSFRVTITAAAPDHTGNALGEPGAAL